MATKFCPRCKEQRLKDWFGDPKAPYAICLSCRIEVKAEEKTQKQQAQAIAPKLRNCAICDRTLFQSAGDICGNCQELLKLANNSVKILGRAASYISGKLRRPSGKHKRFKHRNTKLGKLIHQQYIDDKERGLRFEHAISK